MGRDRAHGRRRTDTRDSIHVDATGTHQPDPFARTRPDADAVGVPGETASAAAAGPVPGTAVTSIQEDERGVQVETAAPSTGESPTESVVRRGGVATSDAEAEDVTRDTHGLPLPTRTARDREERIANADRAAEQAGMPGVDLPESPFEVKERVGREEPKRKS
jgi:hypothetical protein